MSAVADYLTWTLSIDCSSIFFQAIVMKCANTMHVKSFKFSAFISAGRGAITTFSWQQILWIMQFFIFNDESKCQTVKMTRNILGSFRLSQELLCDASETFPFSRYADKSWTCALINPSGSRVKRQLCTQN